MFRGSPDNTVSISKVPSLRYVFPNGNSKGFFIFTSIALKDTAETAKKEPFSWSKGLCKGHKKRCKGHVQGPQKDVQGPEDF